MAFLVIIELTTLWFSISTLSAVRASVAGEGLWSKAQKNAVFHLRTYAYSHKEADYNAFNSSLEVPESDRRARAELKKDNPDKKFYVPTERLVCPTMKLTTLGWVAHSLEAMEHEVRISGNIRDKAYKALERMLKVSGEKPGAVLAGY